MKRKQRCTRWTHRIYTSHHGMACYFFYARNSLALVQNILATTEIRPRSDLYDYRVINMQF